MYGRMDNVKFSVWHCSQNLFQTNRRKIHFVGECPFNGFCSAVNNYMLPPISTSCGFDLGLPHHIGLMNNQTSSNYTADTLSVIKKHLFICIHSNMSRNNDVE